MKKTFVHPEITFKIMKLSKALLGAILVGVTVQTIGCTKKDAPEPKKEKGGKEVTKSPDNCPACGMG